MCIYVDDDYTVLAEGERQARKPHKCSECSRVIDPGERYRFWTQTSDFGIETYKMCAHCWATIDLGATFTNCPRNWWWGMAIPTSTQNGAFDETFVGDIIGNHDLTVSQVRTMVRCIRGRRRGWRKDGDLLPLPAAQLSGPT